ncbi:MAG: glycine zipper 2TM domain-containing protein [Deltaproteobacteria bacterium]|nr:glycine zipper 2TM domain-containing protein [Deltaproteobacteria bacterium]
MSRGIALFSCCALLVLTGCATNAQTGALGGAGAGALMGQLIGGNTKSTLIGTGIGLGLGYLIGNEMDKKQAQERSTMRPGIWAERDGNRPAFTQSRRNRRAGSLSLNSSVRDILSPPQPTGMVLWMLRMNDTALSAARLSSTGPDI